MSTVAEATNKLDEYATELDKLSRGLANVARQLEPVAKEYDEFISNYELGLYDRSLNDANFKLPSEAMRLKLAIRDMSPELYGRYVALTHSQDRMKERIRRLGQLVDGQRSILSALKSELEATR